MKDFFRQRIVQVITASQNFIALTGGLLILFVSLRFYEFIAIAASHTLASPWYVYFLISIAYDLLFVLTVAALMAIPFLLLALWRLTLARILFALFAGCILLLHLGLIAYYINTTIPLGADFYGYPWKEINLTVNASAGISIWTWIPFIFFFGLAAALFIFSQWIRISSTMVGPFFVLLVLALVLRGTVSPTPGQFKREADFNLAVNKCDFFLRKSWIHFTSSEKASAAMSSQYPLYHTVQYNDVLGRFFKHSSENPNLVFIIVEGLGRDFTGEGAAYGGFTPFVDSLMRQSLYWENFLSTAGRTFNVLPSEFGSLPYGANGFMELGGQMPVHQTLISILKPQGYYSHFFYGGDGNFDLMNVFLDRQGIDFMLDQNQFGPEYRHADANEKGFSWGYDDGDVFQRSLEIINAENTSPRLDIYLTLTTHEPFSPPQKQMYWDRFEERFAALSIPEEKKKIYRDYKEVFSTLLYFDDALRRLFTEYKKRGDYERTIFFITGDHRLIPVPMGEQIDRFHVPFIISSPMLLEPRKFSSISTHSDVTPTVLAFLHAQYHIEVPPRASWLSSGIDTAREFRNIHSMPLMRNKDELIDYIDGLTYLAGEQAYTLSPGLEAEKTDDANILHALQQHLTRFKEINNYVCENNRIIPDTLHAPQQMLFTPHDDSVSSALQLNNYTPDQLYERARTAAFNTKYDEARTICRWLLRKNPRNADVLVLYGHTYAWDKDYETARSIFRAVLHRMPDNTDALSSLVDLELWSGNNTQALFLADSALAGHMNSVELLVRKSKALANLGRTDDAKTTLKKILKINPDNEEAAALKRRLGL